jgi:uncharacterized membrane protein
MFVVHASRIEKARVPPAGFAELCDRAISALRWAEPFIAASFLFIAGFSLVLSKARFGDGGTRKWCAKVLGRALGLYLLSVALFVPQYGVGLPDLLVSSGVLSAIALSIALIGVALASSWPVLTLSAIGLCVLAVTAALDRGGGTVPGLNAGPGGAFPLVAFAAFGALVARAVQLRGLRSLGFVLAIALPVTGAALLSGEPWLTERTSHYAGASASSVLGSLLRGEPLGPKIAVAFWNHSAIGALGLLFPLCASLWAALAAQRAIERAPIGAPLLLLGRHALFAYVLHLGLLGAIDALGLSPSGPVWTLALVLALALICCAIAAALERRTVRAEAKERCDRAPA